MSVLLQISRGVPLVEIRQHIALKEMTMEQTEMVAVDTNALPWEERYREEIGRATYRKLLMQDPDTGMEVRLVRYPAGLVTPWHTHPCAHGIYVLDGTLVTHAGRYSPGNFVWFPEGVAMRHGAADEGDATVLFITNKPFEIHFLSG
jgi:quercetin dioxygenase-like cupin family protein